MITMGAHHESVRSHKRHAKHVTELFVTGSVVSIDRLYLTNTRSVGSVNHILWRPATFQPKVPSLYVEILIDGDVQRTRVIKRDIAPTWNTDFILSAALTSVP